MKPGTLACVVLACWGMAAGGGCVLAGKIDPRLVSRYQRTMARRGPQRRAGHYGPNSLLPVSTGPELKVVRDPKTGKARVLLSLAEAVQRALANSLDIRVVSFDPAISREEMIQAAAEFDFIVHGAFEYSKEDNRTDSVFGGGMRKARVFSAGVRKKTVTGAEVALDWSWTRSWSDLSIQTLRTRHEPVVALSITQPLLRDGGREVNLATLHIARLNHKITHAQFRKAVEETVSTVVATYWQLIQARQGLQIQQSLLKRTTETLDRIRTRRGRDATAVQVKQAEAAVESRRAGIIRARKTILDVQGRLGRLLADKQINVLSQTEIIPSIQPVRTPVTVNATDQLVTALRRSPVLEEARLAIQVADVTVRVARNQTLPRLDLTASTGFQGLGRTYYQAREQLHSGDYASYAVGISLEYPVGNRAARAELRKSRFERLKAVTALQNLADQVAVDVNERVRQITTAFEEMRALQAAVAAAKVQLQGLEDAEKLRAQLTPAFLNTKLSAQETLAEAERAELQATIEYNTAMTDLARTTGTILDRYHVELQKTLGPADLSAFRLPAKRPAKPGPRP